MVNVAIISDLHIDKAQNLNLIPAIKTHIDKFKPDFLIICGDISHSDSKLEYCFRELSCLHTKVMFVPGNHDIWQLSADSPDSWHKYYHRIPELCYKHDIIPLWMEPTIFNNVGFCGTMGWYDYSFRKPGSNFTDDDYKKKQFKRIIWNDKRFANWGTNWNDKKICRHLNEQLIKHIDNINNKVDKIVVVTHFLAFCDILIWSKFNGWDYFGAFMGNAELGKIISQYDKVDYVFSGHVHVTKDVLISNRIRNIISPIGNPKEWNKEYNNIQTLVSNRVKLISI